METILGLAILGWWCFTIWMWVDALTVPGPRWNEVAAQREAGTPKPFIPETKGSFFAMWYLGGLLTFGLVPMCMAIAYFRSVRPKLRPGTVKSEPRTFTLPAFTGAARPAVPPEAVHAAGSSQTSAPVPTRECPWCAEDIKPAARVCRYCGHDIDPVGVTVPPRTEQLGWGGREFPV